MKKVTVIAAAGASVGVPAVVRLTESQAASRMHLLAETGRKGVYEVIGTLNFKCGEVFGLDTPERLNRTLFDWPETPPKVEDKKAPETPPKVEDNASPADTPG